MFPAYSQLDPQHLEEYPIVCRYLASGLSRVSRDPKASDLVCGQFLLQATNKVLDTSQSA